MSKDVILSDKVANIILSDKSCRGFLVDLVSKSINIDKKNSKRSFRNCK